MRKQLLSPLRKMLGIAELDRLTSKEIYLAQQAHGLHVAQLNRSTFDDTAGNEVKESPIVQRAQKIVLALSPKDLANAHYVRIGRNFDGGYVMLDHFPPDLSAAYSFGVNDDVSWDEQVAERGIPVYLYDHTIAGLPKPHPRLHFRRVGICGYKRGPDLLTLSECLNQNGHSNATELLLKIDVEGYEWDVFSECSPELLAKFQQIVVEYHGLTLGAYQARRFQEMIQVLEKLNGTHQVVHVHANSLSSVLAIKRLVLPDLMEVTYVRRSDFAQRVIQGERVFPTALDEPTSASSPDVYLGRFNGEL